MKLKNRRLVFGQKTVKTIHLVTWSSDFLRKREIYMLWVVLLFFISEVQRWDRTKNIRDFYGKRA